MRLGKAFIRAQVFGRGDMVLRFGFARRDLRTQVDYLAARLAILFTRGGELAAQIHQGRVDRLQARIGVGFAIERNGLLQPGDVQIQDQQPGLLLMNVLNGFSTLSLTMGVGRGSDCPKLVYVIHGRPLNCSYNDDVRYLKAFL